MNNQYFKTLHEGFEPAPVLAELDAFPELWSLFTARQKYQGSAHADTQTIPLRGPLTLEDPFEDLEAYDYPIIKKLPATVAYLRQIALGLGMREIGRVMLVRLKPGGVISEHIDEGGYARYFARFHAPLSTGPQCLFRCGPEQVHMEAGSLWWFNHQRPHSVRNLEKSHRIHLIADAAVPGFTGALQAAA